MDHREISFRFRIRFDARYTSCISNQSVLSFFSSFIVNTRDRSGPDKTPIDDTTVCSAFYYYLFSFFIFFSSILISRSKEFLSIVSTRSIDNLGINTNASLNGKEGRGVEVTYIWMIVK